MDDSKMSPFAKRFWEIMNQVDSINEIIEVSSKVTDEEFKQIITNEMIEAMKSLIDRHSKIVL